MVLPRLFCNNCNYKFTPKERIPRLCPYCGARNSLEKAKQMQEWISEFSEEVKE